MFDYKDVVLGYLTKAGQAEDAISKDPLLSDQGRRQKRLQHVDPLYYEARRQAADWLSETRAARVKAEERQLAARRAAAAKVDIQKRAYALERAKLVAEHAPWSVVEKTMQEAVELQDADSLAAWSDLEPMLRGRFDGKSGPAGEAGSGIFKRCGQVRAALAAQVDPDVATAAAELAEATDALAEAEGTLHRVDFRRGVVGLDPVFRDLVNQARTVTEGGPGPEDGRWVISSEGGGAFG